MSQVNPIIKGKLKRIKKRFEERDFFFFLQLTSEGKEL